MMQRTLESRFGLRTHQEAKVLPVYEMVAGPGGQHLTPAEPPERQKKLVIGDRSGASLARSAGKFSAVAISLDLLASWVADTSGLERPLLNGTHLDGLYKVELHWDPPPDEGYMAKDPGILGALKSQLGLVLQKRDMPVDILVIDQVNRQPTANL